MDKMKIEIWSDIACPYCYIGKRKLEKALFQFPEADNIELVWHSYELNPSLPKGISNKTYSQYLSEVEHATEEEVQEKIRHIVELAEESGLTYNTDKINVTNTADALRMVKLADKYNLATQAEEVLFKAYFTDGKNISDIETLILLGNEIGIPRGDLSRMLNTPEYSELIMDDMNKAENELNLEYIPFYLLNNKQIVQGSISVEDYLSVIEKAYTEWKLNGVAEEADKDNFIAGQSCSIDGVCS